MLDSTDPAITTKGDLGIDPFYNLTANAGGIFQTDVQVDNDLTISGGTLRLNNNDLTVIRHVGGAGTLQADGTELILVGGGFDPTGYTANNSTVRLNLGTGGNLGGLTYNNLEFVKTFVTDTLTSTGGLTVTGSLVMTTGTWDAATFTHDIRVDWDATSANFAFTPSTSTISMTTTADLTINCSASNDFWNLYVYTSVDLSSDIVVLNDVRIFATGDLDVTAANRQITVGHDWTRDNLGVFNPRNGLVIFNDFTANGELSTTDPAGETFWDLRIAETGGTFTYQNDFTIIRELHIASGTLAEDPDPMPENRTITMGTLGSPAIVYWDNDVVDGSGFSGGDGKVEFVQPGPGVEYHIEGRTAFYAFECLTPGAILKFEDNTIGTYTCNALSGVPGSPAVYEPATIITGNFYVDGGPAGPNITLNNISGVDVVAACGANPNANHWVLHITSFAYSALATIDWIDVSNSWAPPIDQVTPGPNHINGGSNCNWLFSIPIRESWTVDSDSNGRIDAIRVLVEPNTQLNDDSVDESQITIVVQGYELATPAIGIAGVSDDDVFDILLVENDYLDTDARPQWQFLANDSFPNDGLLGQLGGAYVESGSTVYTPDDGARPVIAYTLAVVGETKAYLHFSEPVYSDQMATIGIQNNDFNEIGGTANPIVSVTPLETSGIAAHAAMIEFTNPLLDTDVVGNPPKQLRSKIPPDAIWDGRMLDPTITDPAIDASTTADGNLQVHGSDYMDPGIQHRVSDVALNLIEPVFAYDAVIQRDPVRGGIGRITRFDGSGFLPDRDIQLQARILSSTYSGATVDIVWDVNPTDPILLSNLWIPSGVTTMTHIPPFPPNTPGDTYHNANTTARSDTQTGATGPLRDFLIPSSDPEIQDGADLQFLFVIDPGGTEVLPYARIPNPEDPRTARPWVIKIRDLRTQRGEATVTNNVINPLRGETVNVTYSIPQTGMVTINVFDLKGDIVDVLYRGQRTAGEYSTTWDGRNRGNRVVARGVYFIKIVGPGISEIRKVLVVK